MNDSPDDLRWLPESRMLGLCQLPRSVLNSWKRAGLDLTNEAGAYGLAETIHVLLLGSAREHIAPKDMTSAWREIVMTGAHEEIVRKAREIGKCRRFDLVVDPEYASLAIATDDRELIDAVCHPNWPRPVVVVDVAERVADVVRAFHKRGDATARPKKRSPGRPRSAARLRSLDAKAGS